MKHSDQELTHFFQDDHESEVVTEEEKPSIWESLFQAVLNALRGLSQK